ncbi:MBL fold metallo-hydrolase [Pararobbsia silviterrae]|uniref:MBL fold metallo-hydrolase n=1 Tax=Pararobbsia silviterrae TaxID=1792498 RepID=A0A494XEY3_9BURK|nr:MBL fold metallo-hydrolase [Pararobbsia silviterrae]RKP46654.1 MBL fold metallo-hydrolase [Pararobbsia silviterrae]
MRFTSLGSGSEGNALVVEVSEGASTTRVLLDCGFSVRELQRRLLRAGLDFSDLDALIVTHEHTDHVGSALTLARKARLPVFMSWGTALACGADDGSIDLRILWAGDPLAIGDIEIHPYTVPHDAREPLQFVFSDGDARLGVLTDTGCPTPHIVEMLGGADALVLECNHDREMLAASRYPASLKRRIAGDLGHLANDAAAHLLAQIDRSRMRHLIAAHLSQQNNTPELAKAALAQVVGAAAGDIVAATQADGFDWRTL